MEMCSHYNVVFFEAVLPALRHYSDIQSPLSQNPGQFSAATADVQYRIAFLNLDKLCQAFEDFYIVYLLFVTFTCPAFRSRRKPETYL